MVRVRHALLAILAIAGLLSAFTSASASAACPVELAAFAQHRGDCEHRMPVTHDAQLCAACLAVLPAPAPMGSHTALAATPFSIQLQTLAGIDPALDPPPPRGA